MREVTQAARRLHWPRILQEEEGMRLAPEHDSSPSGHKTKHSAPHRSRRRITYNRHCQNPRVLHPCAVPPRVPHRPRTNAHEVLPEEREVDVTTAGGVVEVVDVGMLVLTVAEVRHLAQHVQLESLRGYAVSSDRKEGEAGRGTHHVHG